MCRRGGWWGDILSTGAGGHVREWGLNVVIGMLQQKRMKRFALKVRKSGSDF